MIISKKKKTKKALRSPGLFWLTGCFLMMWWTMRLMRWYETKISINKKKGFIVIINKKIVKVFHEKCNFNWRCLNDMWSIQLFHRIYFNNSCTDISVCRGSHAVCAIWCELHNMGRTLFHIYDTSVLDSSITQLRMQRRNYDTYTAPKGGCMYIILQWIYTGNKCINNIP